MTRVAEARAINAAHGGPLIAAWEVDQLPEDWIEAISAMSTKLAGMQAGIAKLEAEKAAWRNRHPTYRKH